MKIGIAVWNDKISPVFDVSRQILIVDIENGDVSGKKVDSFAKDDLIYKARKLAELKVQTLICGAVSRPASEILHQYGIRTIPFITGEVEEVITAYLKDNLPNPAMSMPGCCGRRKRCVL